MARKLENTITAESKKDIRLGRIAITTLGYGFVGAFFVNDTVIAPLTASLGLGASLYDEFKQKGMNLVWPAAGILVGGFIGSLFDIDQNQYAPYILSYGGATLGGALGFYKSYISRETSED